MPKRKPFASFCNSPFPQNDRLLTAPEGTLRALCQALGVPFDGRMLAWPPGPRDSDGVWAPWWYDSVRASTGFAPYRPPGASLPGRLEPLADRCLPHFDRLYHYRITPAGGPDAANVR